MRIRTCAALAVALVAAAVAMPSFADHHEEAAAKKTQTAAADPAKGTGDQAKMDAAMAEMMKLAAPGNPHAMLAGMVGEWTLETKAWMAPGAPPMESKGTATRRMIMGGRYLSEEVHGDMMGSPFEGLATTGYDNRKQRYVGTWIDNMSTAVMTSEGTYDEKTKTLTMTATMYDAMLGKETTARMVTKFIDASTHVFEFWGEGPDGKDMKGMEITYRKKSS